MYITILTPKRLCVTIVALVRTLVNQLMLVQIVLMLVRYVKAYRVYLVTLTPQRLSLVVTVIWDTISIGKVLDASGVPMDVTPDR